MTAPKSLPPRPSLESLRKQAKKLARDIAAGDAGSIARARVQLPKVHLIDMLARLGVGVRLVVKTSRSKKVT